ncbi:methylated-DNA--[protein]-cysteine S-methyltransferase [Desulfosporosinus sp. OT]|uniref:methylated-DNA--[protein]-cysteine S-methyltransferase n=1 Tax=Desulfosporosinus sp. OT TaxID=913865 RepID=UPI000223A7F3|nr:methylated-DNA--[protein]-cysteine S-methyltransferase [Desulfosporosinus sp. OT]EGW37056.1 methylated-DNA-[]-cysteine S-methyltransferase family protein [Desulfosporosinus sp. OT]
MKNVYFYNFPIGKIGIEEDDGSISRVFFSSEKALAGHDITETPLIQKAASQLTEYFAGERKEFDLPLALEGTEFQMAVWKALQAIPSGETRSYQDIAKAVGKPQASRAVGMANNKNPILIIVPCHRVIGQDGSLAGYVAGVPAKEYLLGLEKRHARYCQR